MRRTSRRASLSSRQVRIGTALLLGVMVVAYAVTLPLVLWWVGDGDGSGAAAGLAVLLPIVAGVVAQELYLSRSRRKATAPGL